MAVSTLVGEIHNNYFLTVSPDYVARVRESDPQITANGIYRRALLENIKDVANGGVLPFGLASHVTASLPKSVVLQISSSRDATQPLRPCADSTEEDIALGAALQKVSNRRLLRLTLTDGYADVPACELSTLSVFKGIPIPGEKVLLKAGAEVRNGCIILTEDNISLLGGAVAQLKQEFLERRRRLDSRLPIGGGGLDHAPKFEPLQIGHRYQPGSFSNAAPRMTNTAASGARGGVRGPPAPHGERGGSHKRGRGGDRGGGGRGGRFNRGGPTHGARGGRSGYQAAAYAGGARYPHYQQSHLDPHGHESRPPALYQSNFPSLA